MEPNEIARAMREYCVKQERWRRENIEAWRHAMNAPQHHESLMHIFRFVRDVSQSEVLANEALEMCKAMRVAPSTEPEGEGRPAYMREVHQFDPDAPDARRQRTRPGRFLSSVLHLPDRYAELFARSWETAFDATMTATLEFEVGRSPDDFERIYCAALGRSREDFTTTVAHKSLAASCMQGLEKFDSLSEHPTRAYGDADFEILAAWFDGALMARCVIGVDPTSGQLKPGPVYAVSRHALHAMLDRLRERDAAGPCELSWQGLRLSVQSCDDRGEGYILTPYLDVGPVSARREDGFLVLDNRGCIGMQETCGYAYNGTLCYYCGEHIPDGEEIVCPESHRVACECCYDREYATCDDCGTEVRTCYAHEMPDDTTVCDDCRDSNFSVCDESGEYMRHEESCAVWRADAFYLSRARDGHYLPDSYLESEETWSEESRDNHAVYCEHTDSHWHSLSAVITEDDEYVPITLLYATESRPAEFVALIERRDNGDIIGTVHAAAPVCDVLAEMERQMAPETLNEGV